MGVNFTKKGAERIATVTKYVEGQPRNNPRNNRKPSQNVALGFWAKITDSDDNGKYSWEAMKPNSSQELEVDTDWGQGSHSNPEGYAVEAKNKSKWVLDDSIVFMWPAKTEEYYLFDYMPGVIVAKLLESETISERLSATPGYGDITYEKYDGSTFTDGQVITVYNPFRTEILADSENDLYVEAAFGDGGVWWLIAVDCKVGA